MNNEKTAEIKQALDQLNEYLASLRPLLVRIADGAKVSKQEGLDQLAWFHRIFGGEQEKGILFQLMAKMIHQAQIDMEAKFRQEIAGTVANSEQVRAGFSELDIELDRIAEAEMRRQEEISRVANGDPAIIAFIENLYLKIETVEEELSDYKDREQQIMEVLGIEEEEEEKFPQVLPE